MEWRSEVRISLRSSLAEKNPHCACENCKNVGCDEETFKRKKHL
ncbi:hypothetical protein T4C_11625 [Trichinella pseudospiralis]|uniref:Uncharacterized protein n=1 Tax=Trichinella pseudospiralis TaxID=6337 RepID=A0A0V1GPA0_TRIPS|nr:hypothetical protein T4C_11625 [Trichinella pseudospiralis]